MYNLFSWLIWFILSKNLTLIFFFYYVKIWVSLNLPTAWLNRPVFNSFRTRHIWPAIRFTQPNRFPCLEKTNFSVLLNLFPKTISRFWSRNQVHGLTPCTSLDKSYASPEANPRIGAHCKTNDDRSLYGSIESYVLLQKLANPFNK